MKSHIKFLSIYIIAFMLALGPAHANTCPAGCFCLNDGEVGTPIPSSGVCRDEHPEPNYNQDGFSGGYDGIYGIYGFKDGEFVYENHRRDYTDNQGNNHSDKYDYVFNCPKSHPHSADGSKGLTDCFKYDASGNKVYYSLDSYGNCNIAGIGSLVANLQSALNQANRALEDLQVALINSGISEKAEIKNINVKNIRSSSKKTSGNDLNAAKAAIKAGI